MKTLNFNEHIICSQVDNVNNYMQTKLFKDGTTLDELIKSSISDIFYVDSSLNIVTDITLATWAFVKFTRVYGGKPTFFIAKFDKEAGVFDGYMVGNLSHITCNVDKAYDGPAGDYFRRYSILQQKLEEDKKSQANQKHTVTKSEDTVDKMVNEIYNDLLLNNFKTKEGLERFIKIIGARLITLHDSGNTKFMVETATRYAIVNTGLLDSYKEDIYIMYRYHMGTKTYNAYMIVKCKQDWIDNGFKKEDIKNLPPIKFFDSDKSTIGDVSVDDIDIPTGVFHHIIVDNRERLERIIGSDNSTDIIADRIREAINVGIKMLERDSTYIKPYYTTVSGFSWAMPLHIQQSLSEEPEFVLIFVKNGDFFTVKTALPYNDHIKDSLTAVSLYGTKW